MKSIWVLYHRTEKNLDAEHYEMKRLKAAALEAGVHLSVIKPETVEWVMGEAPQFWVEGQPVRLPDSVFVRLGHHASSATFLLLRALEHLGICILNKAEAIEYTSDKARMYQKLSQAALPIPKTVFAAYPLHYDWVEQVLGFPLVLKTVKGTQGRGIILCDNMHHLQDMLELIYAHDPHANTLLQEYIAQSAGRDVRVWVLRGRVLGAIERRAQNGFKANFSRGGEVKPFELTPEIASLALKATRVMGLDLAGVDLLFFEDRFILCEVNAAPGFKGFEVVHGPCVAEAIIKELCVAHVEQVYEN